jgi:hypothetical protein
LSNSDPIIFTRLIYYARKLNKHLQSTFTTNDKYTTPFSRQ